MPYSLITIQQKKEWTAYINSAATYDFYHTWRYHAMDGTGIPFLFVYWEKKNFIAFPLIRRQIEDSAFSDLGSVYGYTGPVSNLQFDQLGEGFIERFQQCFLLFLQKERSVSVFSRLHPLFHQQHILEKLGGLYENGKTICIDLRVPIEVQRKKYKKNIYESLKKSWKAGFRIVQTKRPVDIHIFRDMYRENMFRIGASDYYYFGMQYFVDLLHTNEFDCRLVLVYDGSVAICGSIVTFTRGIVQCHLMATRTDYLHSSPAKFLVDEISQIGRKQGMQYYHLGGGFGFKEDSLFKWKSGFSDFFLNYKSWRFVSNPRQYQSLVQKTGVPTNSAVDFFPLYRYPVHKL